MLQALTIVAHALWDFGLRRKLTTLRNALIAHATAAPLIFAIVSVLYFRWFDGTGPAATAAVFVVIVFLLDVFIVGCWSKGAPRCSAACSARGCRSP